MSLIPVAEALDRVIAMTSVVSQVETVRLSDAVGRVLAAPITAERDQPPFPASAMDGYAVRAADLATPNATLHVIGESRAGRRFAGVLGGGTAVRIFTGAPVPEGADTILIQENATLCDGSLRPHGPEPAGRFVRAAGFDFSTGERFFDAGHRVSPKDLSLLAALGQATVRVRRRPRIALLATGDELVPPGITPGPDQIIASSDVAIAAMVTAWGGDPIALGIAGDSLEAIADGHARAEAAAADVLITLGGASVGDYDLIQPALAPRGLAVAFWRIAMRPGKPLMAGKVGGQSLLGLPGNPASAMVCAMLFLRPMIEAMLGMPEPARDRTVAAFTTAALPANDQRQDYLRAVITADDDAPMRVTALPRQDSSLTSIFAKADGLIVRAPFAEARPAGAPVRFLRLE
jgi:molybdopterin molybdotransferase